MLIRYMGLEFGLQSVQTGMFKLLRPLDANDPYEMMGATVGQLSDAAQGELCDDMRYEWAKAPLGVGGRSVPSIEAVLERVANSGYYFKQIIMDRMIQQSGMQILCFADAKSANGVSDQLMWAHYAGGGRGIRVWIDSDKLPSKYPQIFKVNYQERRPTIDLATLQSYKDMSKWGPFYQQVWLSKSLAWKYENEYRLMVPMGKYAPCLHSDGELEFIQIPHSAITRIDFGPKGYIQETIDIVDRLKAGLQTSHIEYRVATFKEDEYEYDYLDYGALRRWKGHALPASV